MRTTLESGAWIDHVPIQDLRFGHKRKLDRHTKLTVPSGAVGEDGAVDMDAIMGAVDMVEFSAAKQDALWALVIEKWSFDLPVPELAGGEVENAESFDELPLDDAEEIEALFAPFAAKLAKRPNPKGATTSASNGSSRAKGNGSRTA